MAISKQIDQAITILKNGGVISFATETVYALACDASNDKAIRRLYKLKKRSENKPIAVFVKNLSAAKKFLSINKITQKIARKFMPGPLTIIVKKKAGNGLSSLLNNGADEIGFRIPDDNFSLQLLKKFNGVIAATSANISGKNPAINSLEVSKYFGKKIDLIIDGGTCKDKVPSTVIVITKNHQIKIIRNGIITKKQIENEII
jgi:L-threonylcarbamoyladenylate synthase